MYQNKLSNVIHFIINFSSINNYRVESKTLISERPTASHFYHAYSLSS